MASKSIGAWLQRALGGRGAVPRHGTGDADGRIGKQVCTNDGRVLGTVVAVWPAGAAADGAPHEETLSVQRSEQDEAGMVYVPAQAIADVSDKGVVLTVDETQVTARGWRYRPQWLPHDVPRDVGTGSKV